MNPPGPPGPWPRTPSAQAVSLSSPSARHTVRAVCVRPVPVSAGVILLEVRRVRETCASRPSVPWWTPCASPRRPASATRSAHSGPSASSPSSKAPKCQRSKTAPSAPPRTKDLRRHAPSRSCVARRPTSCRLLCGCLHRNNFASQNRDDQCHRAKTKAKYPFFVH